MSPLQFVHSPKPRQRACDSCRKTKRKCDGQHRCSECIKRDVRCTYVKPSVARGRTATPGEDVDHSEYVYTLSQRLRTTEMALAEEQAEVLRDTISASSPASSSSAAPPHRWLNHIRALTNLEPVHPDDTQHHDLAESFGALSLSTEGAADRGLDPGFQGRAGIGMLVKAAVALRDGSTSGSGNAAATPASHDQAEYRQQGSKKLPLPWTLKPWDKHHRPAHHDSLSIHHPRLPVLIDAYFTHVDAYIPLLHRGTFLDDNDNSVLLLVCALGELYVMEEEESATGITDSSRRLERARRWFDQVELSGIRRQAEVHDLQAYCLATTWLFITSPDPRSAWRVLGFGILLLQDIGAHKRREGARTVQAESERRAVWILTFFDWVLSGMLGRVPSLTRRDLDIGEPRPFFDDRDADAHWDDVEHTNGNHDPNPQPAPASPVKFFTTLLQVGRVHQFSIRLIILPNASTARVAIAEELKAVAMEIELVLEIWRTIQVSRELTWDPARPQQDDTLYTQSAVLHCFYFYTRLEVLRPFIIDDPKAREKAACVARACIALVDAHHRRCPKHPLWLSQPALFTSVMILLLCHACSCSCQSPTSPESTLEYGAEDRRCCQDGDFSLVNLAVDVLKSQQTLWPASGYYTSLLQRCIALEFRDRPAVDTHHPPALIPTPTPWTSSSVDSAINTPTPMPTPPVLPFTGVDGSDSVAGRMPVEDIVEHELNASSLDIAIAPPVFVGDEEVRMQPRVGSGSARGRARGARWKEWEAMMGAGFI
ncbi:hypothetical protein C8F01DRAFT_1161407 [Mycena amicta]|nr:hypothetical protein C8F01DRAFT_1161407 [Mycena amicta]